MEDEKARTPIQRDVINQVQDAVLDINNPIAEQMELLRRRLDKLEIGGAGFEAGSCKFF